MSENYANQLAFFKANQPAFFKASTQVVRASDGEEGGAMEEVGDCIAAGDAVVLGHPGGKVRGIGVKKDAGIRVKADVGVRVEEGAGVRVEEGAGGVDKGLGARVLILTGAGIRIKKEAVKKGVGIICVDEKPFDDEHEKIFLSQSKY